MTAKKIHPVSVKCIVLDATTKKALTYNEEEKRLFLAERGLTEFPSKSSAKDAVWHTCQFRLLKESAIEPWNDYEIEEC